MMRFNEVVQEKLNRADSHGEISFLRYKPMLVPPRPWLSVDRGGFLSQKTVFMRTHGSQLQTESLYHADLHNIFKSLNTLSKVGWVVNKEVLSVDSKGMVFVHKYLAAQPGHKLFPFTFQANEKTGERLLPASNGYPTSIRNRVVHEGGDVDEEVAEKVRKARREKKHNKL